METHLSSCLYTVGHSTQPVGRFLSLLERHHIEAIADVRSSPYSLRNPDYGRETLKERLRERGISYVFLGDKLGGRGGSQTELTEEGRVIYRSIAASPAFADGIRRLEAGSEKMRVAAMCSEADPLRCHRGLLISRVITAEGRNVQHILRNGNIEDHKEAEVRLLDTVGLAQVDELFRSAESTIADAYALQEARVAYVASALTGEH